MAAGWARVAASIAMSAARTAMAASSLAQVPSPVTVLRMAPACTSALRTLRTPEICMGQRAFSVAASAAAAPSETSSRVIDVVDEELRYEKEVYTKPEMTPLPEGWSVTERPDDAQVSLTREYNGEVIQVDFLAREDDDEDMEYDDEDEEEEAAAAEGEEDDIVPLDAVSFEVAIVKEGSDKTLVFEAETNGDYLRILDASLRTVTKEEGEHIMGEDEVGDYGGPVFSQLDEKLQQAFVDYLAERGVNEQLGMFIVEYSADKEQREYMGWLEGVHSFLKAK